MMPRDKVSRVHEYVEVVYTEEHWRILEEKRAEARRIMEALASRGLSPIVHGSVARGDVKEASDVDVVVPYPSPPYLIEIALETAGYRPVKRLIVQATPNHTPKVYYMLDEEELRMVSFPLVKLKQREYEFYRFGGMLDLEQLGQGLRVPGVDKRLVLIEPTEKGHREAPVIGRESEVARIVGVSVETVMERVRVLTRRDRLGRTGVFVKYELAPDESVGEAVRRLAAENKHFRRIVWEGGLL